MTVLTSKLRVSIRRVVQGRGLTFRQLRWLCRYLMQLPSYSGTIGCAIAAWPDYQRDQYIRELLQ